MNIKKALERAVTVFLENRYIVLATQDENGPWAAALAHTFVEPNLLCFFSQRTSRHGRILLNGGKVAGVIYNSQCSPEDAESIQFSGSGKVAHDRETISAVLAAGNNGNLPSETEVDDHLNQEDTALFKVEIKECWVLDQEAFLKEGIDARVPVDVAAFFTAIRESR